MNKHSKIKLSNILVNETDNVCMNTNYTAVALVVTDTIIKSKELTKESNTVTILNTVDKYCCILAEIAIIDRPRFKSLLLNIVNNRLHINKIEGTNLSSLLGLCNGEVDTDKDLSELITVAKNCFSKGH